MAKKGRGYGSGAPGSGGSGGSGGGGPQMNFSMMAPMTPVVKALIIANVAIWLILQLIVGQIAAHFFHLELNLTYLFGLVPDNFVHRFFVWQPLTYMFLHSMNPFHILFNMLLLWWLGGELEQRWGSRFFTVFYLVTGVGAGLIYVLAMAAHAAIFNSVTPAWTIPVVGASGAIFGLMLAYGLIFGERVVYFMMLFPMRAKYFTMILGAVEVVTLMNNGVGGDVANLAHVGGLLSGFLFLRTYTALQQRKWRKGGGGGGGAKARGRGLKLVVNNDNKKDDGGPNSGGDGNGPKYWN